MDYYLLGIVAGTGTLALIISIISYFLSRIRFKKPAAFIIGVSVFEIAFIAKGFLVSKDIPINIIYISLGIAVALILIAIVMKYEIIQVKLKRPERFILNESALKKMIAVIATVALLFAGVSVYYYTLYTGLSNDYTKLEGQLSVKEKTIRKLGNQNNSLLREGLRSNIAMSFYMNNACIVTTTGNKYHRFGCSHIENRDYWIYNTEAAEQKGYAPCLDCWTHDYLSNYL